MGTIYATVLSGFGSEPTTGSKLTLADVTPTPGSEIYLLGYENEANRTRIPIAWSSKQDQQTDGKKGGVVIDIPADLAAHPAIQDPGMTFVIQGRPSETFVV